MCSVSFFFNDTPPPAIYTLSLHDALPIFQRIAVRQCLDLGADADRPADRAGARRRSGSGGRAAPAGGAVGRADRKSTRLNSSHVSISYAVFCLKKKKEMTRGR